MPENQQPTSFSDNTPYLIVTSDNPKNAFNLALETAEMWASFLEKENYFTPKRFTIKNDPKHPYEETKAISFLATSEALDLRTNYAGCMFLSNERYMFYMNIKK